MQREIWENKGTHIGGGNGNVMTSKASLNICYWWTCGTFNLMTSLESEANTFRGELEEHALRLALTRVEAGASAGYLERDIGDHKFYGWWTVE